MARHPVGDLPASHAVPGDSTPIRSNKEGGRGRPETSPWRLNVTRVLTARAGAPARCVLPLRPLCEPPCISCPPVPLNPLRRGLCCTLPLGRLFCRTVWLRESRIVCCCLPRFSLPLHLLSLIFFPYSTFISVSPRPPRKPWLNLTTSTSPTSFLAGRLLPFISLVGTAFPLSMRYLLPSSYLHPYPKPCSPHSALPYPLVIRATHLTALHVLPFCANTSNELTHLHYTLLLILYTCSLRGKDASVARGVKA